MTGIGIYSRSEIGHRKAYIDFISTLFKCQRLGMGGAVFSRSAVFFLMIEESFGFFVLASMLRAMIGRRTVGLLFRPGPAVHGTRVRHRLKRAVLGLMKRLGSIKVLTIVPFSLDPAIEAIADDWLYDLQLWDLSTRDKDDLLPGRGTALETELRLRAHERPIITALGFQDCNKGFDTLAGRWCENGALRERYLFAYGGKVAAGLQPLAERFAAADGFGLNRYITDDELYQFYAASSAVWCLYDKGYDQASGILGRAIQFGLPAIVREGSLSHRLCLGVGAPHVAATLETIAQRLSAGLPGRDASLGARLASRFRVESVRKLADALGADLQP